ncbi:hypothetical protein HYV10_00075 [Candidatus Dependentiae bacterium]|nr:hypothetical protein [Candidatus Dependentiae bacterium]
MIQTVSKWSVIKSSFTLKTLILLSLFYSSFISTSGFDGDTLVTTASGRLKPIKELQVGDEVFCYNSNLQHEINHIKGVYAFKVDATMHITTQDNISIITGLMERFYLPLENQWVCAKDLKEGDCLLNEDLEYIAITHVEKHEVSNIMFLIAVDNQHNFLASQGKYLVHNGAVGAAVGVVAGASTVVGIYGGLTALVGVISGPAAPVVVPIWCFWTAAPAAVATKVGGIAGGIIVGVATGPV